MTHFANPTTDSKTGMGKIVKARNDYSGPILNGF